MSTIQEINDEYTKKIIEAGDKRFKIKLFTAEIEELDKACFKLQDDMEEAVRLEKTKLTTVTPDTQNTQITGGSTL